MIFGTAIISGCMLIGFLIGESIGMLLGVGVNIGGVGFSMICLLLLTNWMKSHNKMNTDIQTSIRFWRGMYIPVVVAMAASQDVASALSQGVVAIAAGIASVAGVVVTVFLLSKRGVLS